MNVIRNEIRTGLLVVLTLVVLIGVLIYLAAPGALRKMAYYQVYFDNAGGIQLGAPVMLAGRRVGQVHRLISPVPPSERPRPNLEAIIVVEVRQGSRIFCDAKPNMLQYSLLGEQVIDFASGNETAGLANKDTRFIGERQAGLNEAVPKVLEKLDPVVKSATSTMDELQKTAIRLTSLTAEGGDLTAALANFKDLTGNLVELSGTDGPLRQMLSNLEDLTNKDSPLSTALRNAEQFTGNLSKNKDIDASLTNFREASQKLNTTVQGLNNTVRGIRPNLEQTVHNASQFTDTIKHQPWRLIWPTTKKYPEEAIAERRQSEARQRIGASPSPAGESSIRLREAKRPDRSESKNVHFVDP